MNCSKAKSEDFKSLIGVHIDFDLWDGRMAISRQDDESAIQN
jgi:hypothetical protein